MSFLKRWTENYERAMRSKVLIQLKDLPEQHLAVAGISPELLELGVDAWPWRTPEMQEQEMRSQSVKALFCNSRQPAANTVNAAREFDSAA